MVTYSDRIESAVTSRCLPLAKEQEMVHFTKVIQGGGTTWGDVKNVQLKLLWRHADGNVGGQIWDRNSGALSGTIVILVFPGKQ